MREPASHEWNPQVSHHKTMAVWHAGYGRSFFTWPSCSRSQLESLELLGFFVTWRPTRSVQGQHDCRCSPTSPFSPCSPFGGPGWSLFNSSPRYAGKVSFSLANLDVRPHQLALSKSSSTPGLLAFAASLRTTIPHGCEPRRLPTLCVPIWRRDVGRHRPKRLALRASDKALPPEPSSPGHMARKPLHSRPDFPAASRNRTTARLAVSSRTKSHSADRRACCCGLLSQMPACDIHTQSA